MAEVNFSSLISCSWKDSLRVTGHIVVLPLSLLRTFPQATSSDASEWVAPGALNELSSAAGAHGAAQNPEKKNIKLKGPGS